MKNVEILKWSLMVDKLLEIIINNRKRNQKFYKLIDAHSVTHAIDEIDVSVIFFVVTFFVGR